MGSAVPLSVLSVAVLLLCSDAAKILIVPANINSHVIYFGRLAKNLAELGHSTHMLVASNAHIPKDVLPVNHGTGDASKDTSGPSLGDFSIERYHVEGNASFTSSPYMTEVTIKSALASSTLEKFRILSPFWMEMLAAIKSDCFQLLSDSALLERLRSAGFDFAIMDPGYVHSYVLPYTLGIPHYATLSVPTFAIQYGVPRLMSFVSDFGHTDRMSFKERMSSLLQSMMLNFVLIAPDTTFSEQFATHRPPMDIYKLLVRSSIWFYLEEPVLSFPRPLMPNTIQVGDLVAGSARQKLPADFDRFLDESVGGVILVSFGSYLDHVPNDILLQFCSALSGHDATLGFIWKQKNSSACDGVAGFDRRRVLLLPWIPQNDLLADPRVRLFVTHGGLNSLIEAVYHGKPTVVVPVFLDQPANAAVVVSRGYGVKVDLAEVNLGSVLRAAIQTVLDDPSYAERSAVASSIMRDRLDTPAERASRAIEHVLKYGDSHLRTGALELSFFEFLMFDLFVALTAGLFLLTCCVGFTGRFAWRQCCSKRMKNKTE